MTARITRNRLSTHAMPMPSAAHCTHQWPGDVIRLMTKRNAKMIGPVNRNFTECRVLDTFGSCPDLTRFVPWGFRAVRRLLFQRYFLGVGREPLIEGLELGVQPARQRNRPVPAILFL